VLVLLNSPLHMLPRHIKSSWVSAISSTPFFCCTLLLEWLLSRGSYHPTSPYCLFEFEGFALVQSLLFQSLLFQSLLFQSFLFAVVSPVTPLVCFVFLSLLPHWLSQLISYYASVLPLVHIATCCWTFLFLHILPSYSMTVFQWAHGALPTESLQHMALI
jgi:hypothetical protein